MSDSFSLVDFVLSQEYVWFIFPLFPLYIIFFISMLAETNRAPFDLPEAEAELVAGYNTEYSGMRFALFFLAEYAMMFIMCAYLATLFFGGFLPITTKYISEILFADSQFLQLFIYLEQVIWLMLKTLFLVFIVMLVRATLPRLGSKELMKFSWYILLPLSMINFIITAFVKFYIDGGAL